MSKKSTARIWTVGNSGGRTSLPYAFTEQGIYMLMTFYEVRSMSNVANKEIMIVDENSIKDKIYLIRGQRVMLDLSFN